MELNGRTVLLTGATGGIGHAIARRLHARGAGLVLTGRRTEVLEPLAAELGARSIAVDLADPAAVERLAADCADVDVLVANAALPASGPVDVVQRRADRSRAAGQPARADGPRPPARRADGRARQRATCCSSPRCRARARSAGSAIYSATKFGLRGFGQGLRGDLRSAGVGVSVVFPGFISDAGMFADANVTLPRASAQHARGGRRRCRGAIEHNRGEVDVAPVGMRLGATFAGPRPRDQRARHPPPRRRRDRREAGRGAGGQALAGAAQAQSSDVWAPSSGRACAAPCARRGLTRVPGRRSGSRSPVDPATRARRSVAAGPAARRPGWASARPGRGENGIGRVRSPARRQAAEAPALLGRRVGAAPVELLVVLHEVGPVGAQPVHEDAADLAAQVQRDAADARRAGVRRRLEDGLDLPRGRR